MAEGNKLEHWQFIEAGRLDPARIFLAQKGRLPTTLEELICWLKEFAAFESGRADAFRRIYEEHMLQCNQPKLLTKHHP